MKHLTVVALALVWLVPPVVADEVEAKFDPTARQKPMPVITELDSSISDDAWVIIVYQVENAQAKMLVPILRPLVPQNGHLVAHPASNSLIIADSYANIRKLIEIVEITDAATPIQATP